MIRPKKSISFFLTLLFFTSCVFFACSLACVNARSIELEGDELELLLKGDALDFFEDSTGLLSIDNIMASEGKALSFIPSDKTFGFLVKKSTSSYWFRIKLKNKSVQAQHYILESFNYRIDSLHFYESRSGKLYKSDSLGVAYIFNKREIKHKNLVHDFWVSSGDEIILYIKVKNRYETPIELVLRKVGFFTSYAVSEYFYLGLFYGSILIIIILNLLAGVYLKSRSHIYYVFYVFFVGTFFLSQDGMGFQYVWPFAHIINDYGYLLSIYFMTIFLLLYTNTFLNLKIYNPYLTKIFYYYIAFRTVLLLINLVAFPEIRHMFYIDLIPFFMAYYCSYIAFRNNYPLSKYFLIGSTILTIGFVFNFLMLFSLIAKNVFTFYFVNVCFLLEMIVFCFALAERIRFYKQHKAISAELKKVIIDKENLIEQFTYKTSHDLSGPVKTILGIANLALISTDKKDDYSYLKMIQATAMRLDEVLKAIAEINIIQEYEKEKTLVEISILLATVLDSEKIKPFKDNISIDIKNHRSSVIREDSYLLYSLLSNIIIFQLDCLHYHSKMALSLDISITQDSCIVFAANNGDIIPREYHEKIVTIFFRLSNENKDLGTFMYTAKLCADKLNAKIIIENIGVSTAFKITIPLK